MSSVLSPPLRTQAMGKEMPEQRASSKMSSSARRSIGLYIWRRPDMDRKSCMVIQKVVNYEDFCD